jgi:hypothetical protein
MSTYIKLSTLEYPRHIGDIQIDPLGMADYAVVEWVDRPTINPKQERCQMAPPVQVNGVWKTNWVVTPIPQEEQAAALKAEMVQAIQDHLDAFARTRDYDDIKSACGYAGCSVPKYDIEGTYARDKRAETWFVGLQILADVQGGLRPMPTSFDQIKPELPQLVWPEV